MRLDEVVVVVLDLPVLVLVGGGVEVVVVILGVGFGVGYGCGRMVMSAHLAGPKSREMGKMPSSVYLPE